MARIFVIISHSTLYSTMFLGLVSPVKVWGRKIPPLRKCKARVRDKKRNLFRMNKLDKFRQILAKKRSTLVRCIAAGYFLIAASMMVILEDGRLPGFLMIGIGKDSNLIIKHIINFCFPIICICFHCYRISAYNRMELLYEFNQFVSYHSLLVGKWKFHFIIRTFPRNIDTHYFKI